MTFRHIGLSELVELLRMPLVRDRQIATAADLAALLEAAGNERWGAGRVRHIADVAGAQGPVIEPDPLPPRTPLPPA